MMDPTDADSLLEALTKYKYRFKYIFQRVRKRLAFIPGIAWELTQNIQIARLSSIDGTDRN